MIVDAMMLDHFLFMALQLADSRLASTREFWRRKLNCPPEVISDPRCLEEIAAARRKDGAKSEGDT